MSFDVFVQYFSDGKSEQVHLDSIRDIFAPYIKEESDTVWEVVYNKSNSSVLLLGKMDKEGRTEGFCINRPCADERLWKSIYDCLSLGNCVIMWPGLEGMITNRVNVRNHVPEEMIEDLGTIRVVDNYNEILDVLNEE